MTTTDTENQVQHRMHLMAVQDAPRADGMFVRAPAYGVAAGQYGTLLQEPPATMDEARTLAGLDWDPLYSPIYDRMVDQYGTETYEEIPHVKRIIRSDTRQSLSFLPPSTYSIFTNTDLFRLIEVILGEGGDWSIGSAGYISNGAKVWVLVDLGEPWYVKGDPSPYKRHMMVMTSHDGTRACQAWLTDRRMSCQNMISSFEAEANHNRAVYAFQHTKHMADLDIMADEARNAITAVNAQQEKVRELLEMLGDRQVRPGQTAKFFEHLIPFPRDLNHMTETVRNNIMEARNIAKGFYDSKTCDGIRDTAAGLFHSAVEYIDHGRGYRSTKTYLGRTLIRPEKLKLNALTLAKKAANKSLS